MTEEAARSALDKHGLNILTYERPPSPIALFFTAVTNPFNFILAVLGIVSIATGDKGSFTVMMVMIIASSSLRFVRRILLS